MKTKISVVIIIFSLFLTTAQISTAQTANSDWNAVKNLAAKTSLWIKTSKGAAVNGDLIAVGDDELNLFIKGKKATLSKNDVEEIYFTRKKSRKAIKIIGGIAGFLAGAVASSAVNKDYVLEEDYNWTAAVVLPLTGSIGGVYLGGLLGKRRKKGALIYKAK